MDYQATRADTVVQDLKKKILTGVLTTGERLPAERELARHYHVSRITIRDAISRLAYLGFVHTLPQSGTFIADFRKDASMDLLADILSSSEEVDRSILIELIEIRRVFETYSAGKAVLRMSDKDRQALKEMVQNLTSSRDDPENMVDTDYAIHAFLIDLAGNNVLRLFFNSFRPVYRFYLKSFYSNPKNAAGIFPYFERLSKAAELRDDRFAAFVMSELLDYAERAMVKILETMPTVRIA